MEDVDSIYIELVGIDNTVDILERGEFDEEALEEVIEVLGEDSVQFPEAPQESSVSSLTFL